MRIGTLKLPLQVITAPMAGITDRPYRTILRELGAGLLFTEMVNARALVLGNRRTAHMYDLSGDIPPVGIQLVGSDPAIMAEAAGWCERGGAAVIDVNMGCPVRKVVKNGEGAALMRDPELAGEIVRRVRAAVSIPVTAKIRSGWSRDSVTAPELAAVLEQAGVDAITVHARTRDQLYSGAADWDVIARVVRAVSVPVIGNGDVTAPDRATGMIEETGCRAVMVARGVLGNPWLVAACARRLAGGPLDDPPSLSDRFAVVRRHLELCRADKGDRRAASEMKKHVCWYMKGLPGVSHLRQRVMAAGSPADILAAIDGFERRLTGGMDDGPGDHTGR